MHLVHCLTHQFFETTNVRGIYSTSEDIIHFGLGDNKKIDSLIITWPSGLKSKLFELETNQSLALSSSSGKNYSFCSNAQKKPSKH